MAKTSTAKKPAVKKPAAKKHNENERQYEDILYEVKDQVAWVTINRPRVLNAFREQTLDEMIDALKSTREDPSIVCAVVTGAGDKSFSAGGDFYAMKRLNFTNAYMWNDRMLGPRHDDPRPADPGDRHGQRLVHGRRPRARAVVRPRDRVGERGARARPAPRSAPARRSARRNTCRASSASGSRAR